MPAYDYKCDNCGNTENFIAPMKDASKERYCPVCKKKMYRLYKFNIGNREYAKPLHSDSLAINPSQKEEHRRRFPNIELDSDCRPVFKNFKEHDGYLKKTGFVKVPQKTKKKGKKLKGK